MRAKGAGILGAEGTAGRHPSRDGRHLWGQLTPMSPSEVSCGPGGGPPPAQPCWRVRAQGGAS